ncbi:MAG: glycosyltransferase family 87 protein, partial [Acidobacteriota bacterium]
MIEFPMSARAITGHASRRTSQWTPLLVLVAAAYAGLLVWALNRPVPPDFPVYWRGANNFFSGQAPMYGDASGATWPMTYRYPPFFLFLIRPFSFIPMELGAKIFALLEWAAVGAASWLAVRTWDLRFTTWTTVATLVLLGPHLLWSLKSGNVQGLLVAASLMALLWAEKRPAWAGALIALAIAIKMWPAVLLPRFLQRERRRALWCTLAFSIPLWLMPALFFGVSGYGSLLGQWYTQESTAGVAGREVWYPSLSLRGVLFRYVTNDAKPVVSGEQYPVIQFADLPVPAVAGMWIAISAAVYGWTMWRAYREGARNAPVWDAATLVLFSILQPFSNKASLIAIWPA